MKNLFVALLMLTFVSGLSAQDGEYHLDKEYPVKKTGMIDLGCSDAKVFVTGSDRSGVRVKIDRKVTAKGWTGGGQDFRVEIEAHEGDLKIRERQSGSNVSIMGSFREEYRIDIEAPEGVSFAVRGDDGDYYIKNINGSISLSIDDADVELSDCKGSEFSFRIDDGNIRMDRGKGNVNIDADDADVEIHNADFRSIHADIADGDLVITTSLDNEGEYRFDAEDGSIVLDIAGGGGEFDIRHDDTHIITEGSFETLLKSEDHTKVALQNGSAKVFVRADDARVKISHK